MAANVLEALISLIAIAAAVIAMDQGSKAAVRGALGGRTLSLGILGDLRVVESRIWLLRARRLGSKRAMWSALGGGFGGAVVASSVVPSVGPWFGLMLGGAFSHALETDWRGSVCDYVCPRFWPAFNSADVALAAGAAGVLLQLVREIL